MSQTIEIEIGDDGMVVHTHGYKGKACLKEQQALVDNLKDAGVDTTLESKTMTAEGQVGVQNKQRQRA